MNVVCSKTHVYWVKPVLPVTLDGIESLPLLGGDKIFPSFNATLVIPGALCIEKLKRALAQTLRDYPHIAGRLSCDPKTQELSIRLTNDGVPVTVGSTNLPYATDEWFHNNEHHPDILDRLPVTSFRPSDELSPQPLARFKITTWEITGETSLSAAWAHVLGWDGTTLHRVMHAWSNYYQDLPPAIIPTFDKYFGPAPKIEQQSIYDTLAQVPHLGIHYSAKRFHEMYNEMVSTTSRVDIKLTFEEIMAIHYMVTKSTKTKVSTMDCLAAYFVTVLNRTEDEPIREISNLLQYRGVKSVPGGNYIPPPITSVGNNILVVHSKLHDTSIGSIVEVIRGQITRTREPENLRRLVGLSNEIINRATESSHLFWLYPYKGAVAINNTFKTPIHNLHFGYPGRTRFYIHNSRERYLRIWPANPVKLPNGTWLTYTGGADINFRVKHARRDAVIKTIKDDLKHMMAVKINDQGNVAKL